MRITLGSGNKRVARSIQNNETERLSVLSQKFSKKSPSEIDALISKTIQSLGEAFKKDYVQTLFIGFVADLCREDDQKLLTDIFNQKVIQEENCTRAFISALIHNQKARAIKMAIAKPSLLFVKVEDKKRAYLFFDEADFEKLYKSEALNDEFFIQMLRGAKRDG